VELTPNSSSTSTIFGMPKYGLKPSSNTRLMTHSSNLSLRLSMWSTPGPFME